MKRHKENFQARVFVSGSHGAAACSDNNVMAFLLQNFGYGEDMGLRSPDAEGVYKHENV